jgi:hypothetical protein
MPERGQTGEIESNMMSYRYPSYTSYASFSSPLYGRVFYTNVKITNPKTDKSVTVLMLADTGAENSQVDGTTYAEPLGIELTKGQPATSTTSVGTVTSYLHRVTIQIGGLKPITNVPMYFTSKKPSPYFNNLGWNGALEKLQINVTPNKLTYSDLAVAAMGNAGAYFRSRV